jgi:hypothetical protein
MEGEPTLVGEEVADAWVDATTRYEATTYRKESGFGC